MAGLSERHLRCRRWLTRTLRRGGLHDAPLEASVRECHETGETPVKSSSARPEHSQPRGHYGRLAVMAVLSFAAMYVLMYAMVDRFDNVHAHYNQVYMAGLMAAPMVIIELALMRAMFPNRRANVVIFVACALATAAFWFAIRDQYAVTERQFLKSMIPHHGGAILMCEKAPLTDGEVLALCDQIVASQKREIEQMKGMLRENP